MDDARGEVDEHITDWWWIDYLENEMDLGLEKDLELLLQCSQEDRDSFEQFRLVREWVRAAEPAVSSAKFDESLKRMRQGVMHALDKLGVPGNRPSYSGGKDDTNALSV